MFRDLCADSFMRKVREEVIAHMPSTFKETDLFKMYQSLDMASFDDDDPECQKKFSHLMALRKALYSEDFREFISKVTGCKHLSGTKTDMAVNTHPHSGHLLCHDDVIGDRAVSFIIYLVDPDGWSADDGGSLELYPLEDPSKNDVTFRYTVRVAARPVSTRRLPVVRIMDLVAGASYHAVQEVFSTTKPRMSIQGWYHSDEPPPNADKASLALLQSAASDENFPKVEGEGDDDEDDEEAGLSECTQHPLHTSATSITHDATLPCTRRSAQLAHLHQHACMRVRVHIGVLISPGKTSALRLKGRNWLVPQRVCWRAAAGEEDVALLMQYINPTYLNGRALGAIAEKFDE
eukprot:1260610-Pyramimonas_sp.AAC.1